MCESQDVFLRDVNLKNKSVGRSVGCEDDVAPAAAATITSWDSVHLQSSS